MAQKRTDKSIAPEKMSFEEATAEVERIIARIESGEIGLEEALEARRRGDQLLRRCRAILDRAEQELEQIAIDEAGKQDPSPQTGDQAEDRG